MNHISPLHRGVSRRSAHALWVALLTLVLAAIGILSMPNPAFAHDSLISTSPASDDHLSAAPASVTLTFSAGVLSLGESAVVIVTAPDGTVVSDDNPVIESETVTQALVTNGAPGTYLVQWRVVSSDGHPIDGEFSYNVDDAGEDQAQATAAPSPTIAASPAEASSTEPAAATPTTAVASHEDPAELTWFFVVATLVFIGAVITTVLLVLRRRRVQKQTDTEG